MTSQWRDAKAGLMVATVSTGGKEQSSVEGGKAKPGSGAGLLGAWLGGDGSVSGSGGGTSIDLDAGKKSGGKTKESTKRKEKKRPFQFLSNR